MRTKWLQTLLLASVAFACSEDGQGEDPLPEAAIIGPGGGTFALPDGRLAIEFPEGALTKDEEVSIEPLATSAPHGVGNAFRLRPEGVKFAKPVTLRFAYGERDPTGLSIAHQADDGRWLGHLDHAIDTKNGTIAVQTDHFSLWALFESMKLEATPASVRVGARAEVSVLSCVAKPDPQFPYLVALVPTCEPLDDASILGEWQVNGVAGGNADVGTIEGSGATASYTTPSRVPEQNPLALSVAVNLPGSWVGQLAAHVEVQESECPLGICTISCKSLSESVDLKGTDEEWNPREEADVTLAYVETENGAAIYRPTSGTVKYTVRYARCSSVELQPDTASVEAGDGELTINLNDDPPTWTGGGKVVWKATQRWTCPDTDHTEEVEASASWTAGGGALVEPYEMKWEQRNDDETSIVTATCTIGK